MINITKTTLQKLMAPLQLFTCGVFICVCNYLLNYTLCIPQLNSKIHEIQHYHCQLFAVLLVDIHNYVLFTLLNFLNYKHIPFSCMSIYNSIVLLLSVINRSIISL